MILPPVDQKTALVEASFGQRRRAYGPVYNLFYEGYRTPRRVSSKDERHAYYMGHRKQKLARQILYGSAHKEEKRAYDAAHYVEHKKEKREYDAAYHAAHREGRHAYAVAYRAVHRDELCRKGAAYHARLKLDAFNAYGGPTCACCGETLFQGLTIDHVNGDGAKWRRQSHKGRGDLYIWLKQHNYPPDFQVLCATCNVAKGTGDHCPHRDQVSP